MSGCPGIKNSPPGPQENAFSGADVHDFGRGRPWPEGACKFCPENNYVAFLVPWCSKTSPGNSTERSEQQKTLLNPDCPMEWGLPREGMGVKKFVRFFLETQEGQIFSAMSSGTWQGYPGGTLWGQARKTHTHKINFLGPETARWGGGLPRERVGSESSRPPSKVCLPWFIEGGKLGCPGNFGGMCQTPWGVQKACAKKGSCAFFVPYGGAGRFLFKRTLCSLSQLLGMVFGDFKQ